MTVVALIAAMPEDWGGRTTAMGTNSFGDRIDSLSV